MSPGDLLINCLTAFAAVFILLSLLAIVMKIMLAIFPFKEEEYDPTIVSAIASTYNTLYPGTKVTKIEEVK